MNLCQLEPRLQNHKSYFRIHFNNYFNGNWVAIRFVNKHYTNYKYILLSLDQHKYKVLQTSSEDASTVSLLCIHISPVDEMRFGANPLHEFPFMGSGPFPLAVVERDQFPAVSLRF